MIENKNCLLCNKKQLTTIYDLGKSPWSNNFSKNKITSFYPLKLTRCSNCTNVQLSYFIKKEKMFLKHSYISSINIELTKHFRLVANKIQKKIKKGNILDIGSNDGSFLKNFSNKFVKIGVEPCVSIKIKNKNIITIKKFFSARLAKKIKIKFDIIHASGVFFHMEELHSVTKGIKHLLKPKGVFVIQFLYLKNIIEKVHFDQIYHEHLVYYTLTSLNKILNLYDLEIFNIFKSSIHGGSIIASVSHKGAMPISLSYKKHLEDDKKFNRNFDKKILIFKKKILYRKKKINLIFNKVKKCGGRVIGVGAPAKAATLINILKIKNYINFTLEINIAKFNKYIPGSNILIINQKDYEFREGDIFFLFTWNFSKSIKKKLIKKFKNKKLIFISPHNI
jgi:2-polyprenyl-3-methyl-5-hydroxy-6-metoxy-1,4-benzoquinol methylase